MKYQFVLSCSLMIVALGIPVLAFGYGEGDDIPYAARATHMMINEARTAPRVAMANCGAKCAEGLTCYKEVLPPVYWDDGAYRAAQFYAQMMTKMNCMQHDTPCTLVSNIGSLFPDECDGSPSCACTEKKATCGEGNGKFSARIAFFTSSFESGAENLCGSGNINCVSRLVNEDNSGSTACAFTWSGTKGNGHRWNLFTESLKSVGVGADGIIVQDFGRSTSETNALTAGSNYTDNGQMWFKTHYYSSTTDVQEDRAFLNLDGECIPLEKTVGLSKKNEVLGTAVSDVSACTSYYFEVLNADGTDISYPTSGSLLYIPSNYLSTVNCEGKSWKNARATSCFATGPKCKSTQHINSAGDDCEADSITACGAHDNNCTTITGWGEGECIDKQCTATGCDAGYHPDGAICSADNIDNCGSKGYKCSAKVTGWDAGTCTNGSCVATSCKSSYHLHESSCEADSQTNCGSHGNNCTNLTGWKEGKCESATCIVTSCQDNFHLYNQSCEADSLERCGEHDFNCAEKVTGWSNGTCTNGECTASSCQNGYHLNNGTCESDSVNSCGVDKIDCSTVIEGWQSGTCEDDTCVPTKCISGYHVYNQSCEADSVEHCGDHETNCIETISDWKSGECQAGSCVVSECKNDKIVSENKCADNGSGENSGSGQSGETPDSGETPAQQTEEMDYTAAPISSDCSGNPVSHHQPLPWLLFGLGGLFMVSRRKRHS